MAIFPSCHPDPVYSLSSWSRLSVPVAVRPEKVHIPSNPEFKVVCYNNAKESVSIPPWSGTVLVRRSEFVSMAPNC
jgi:hypothetical protein